MRRLPDPWRDEVVEAVLGVPSIALGTQGCCKTCPVALARPIRTLYVTTQPSPLGVNPVELKMSDGFIGEDCAHG